MAELNADEIRKRLREALSELREDDGAELPEETRREIIFHLTDWLDDLERWYAFCRDPKSMEGDQIVKLAFAFLIHVPAHVAAAAKLLTGEAVTDVFGVGAVSDEKSISDARP